jgi:hypothetical protein
VNEELHVVASVVDGCIATWLVRDEEEARSVVRRLAEEHLYVPVPQDDDAVIEALADQGVDVVIDAHPLPPTDE